MKNQVLILVALLCCGVNIPGASQGIKMQMFAIEPYPLELTVRKTTHLVFPYPIISVDRGSGDILAQKAKGTGNILQVKAARADFAQTSLTVITADGKLYGFSVDYQPEPAQLSIEFAGEDVARAQPAEGGVNQGIASRLARAATEYDDASRTATERSGIRLEVSGPFIGQKLMLFRVQLANDTDISYHIENLRFFIRDSKKARRSAIQQQQIRPVYVLSDTAVVGGRSQHQMVFAFRQFTISRQKYLAIQAREAGGSRELSLRISAKRIRRPVPLQ
ncbi:conjugative transposon protein TraN [Dyadobacter sp. MSC1_007]|jgi:conjugative transposon TraN protein|uniref:conjugative transposon protein TraN n=1 Tax=Dyadobacter sp. MSC1_007 TaxID=2909264 RepID=UPI0020307C0B|nr:conjugative transposon protein TraN [Dyadobacter sp. MSC1_007]